ncbi:glycoside hydrolase family 3 N-terminal domain-containing protein [Maribellus sp. YY47]|uniref:glycoside hydrolase family 3 N-terminal domain-containing protein n=1 Tax=Maribellus sp. YY47 TaxID=2929486 RepID=UPI00200074EE|nr:glycoside hydrolase family 3 N-terminal domain-containing protein [Maribellus sp. YY47]MCK3685989.1 serine hydrolase [Maribellus sp. YY47]
MKPTPKKYFLLLLLCNFLASGIYASDPPFSVFKNDPWVNEQMSRLSLDEKIAQTMMITAYPKQNEASKAAVIDKIRTYKPGGVLVMQGTPVKTASWINQFQAVSETPLLIAVDGEWGPAMRIDSTVQYPYAQSLGAIQDTSLIYQMGREFGEQLKLLGIQMNFGPVADINTNPSNPVINFRSFGENKQNVAEKAWMVSKGMQDAGVIPVAKHFPGHGDTQTDSHVTLPLVPHSKARLDSIESYSFRYLSKKGISGIMTAHLSVPALDPSGKTSSLSKKVVTDYLKNEMGYRGFIVTDAIGMKGVRAEPGRAEVEALIAGNDMVEFVPDLETAISAVKEAISKKEITEAAIEEKCRTILAIKRWAGLQKYQPAELKDLTRKLNAPKFGVTQRKLIKASLTVLANQKILPVQNLENEKIASVSLGSSSKTAFQTMLDNYTQIDHFVLPKNASEKEWLQLRNKLSNYSLVITAIEGIHKYPAENYGVSAIQQKATEDLVADKRSVIVFFGNAYALKHFSNIHHTKGLILAYQGTDLARELSAQLVFGAYGANGKLPVSVDQRFQVNDGISLKGNQTFSYTIPEEVGMSAEKLALIDTIAQMGVDEKAYPGCQVLVAKDGNVIYHKCFGFLTYDNELPVEKNNVYDWASLTKVTGPLPALMKLVDDKKFNLDDKFSKYWPDFIGSNKENLIIRDILAHQARLAPYISFWMNTVDKEGNLDANVFRHEPSDEFTVRVSEKLYMNPNYLTQMMDTIRNSKLLPRKQYTYSGLSFFIFPSIIEKLTGQSYENYIKNTFYKPLGAYTITYNAYEHFPMQQIVPTENDDLFRKEKICGFAHDEGAAMMNGISGNAGLFGTANDLAKLFQMYLQKGYFGGRRYITEETVNEFTRIQFPESRNRRGLGFDKPLINNYKKDLLDAFPAVSADQSSYGHGGFTGTFAWADPKNGILFIFMSNRVYPTRENNRLYQLNIRTEIHQAIYNSILQQ